MFVVLTISIAAAISFNRIAQEKGYHSPRFWILPLAIGASIQILRSTLGIVAGKLIATDSPFWTIYPPLVGFLSIILLITMIVIAWKKVKALPDRSKPTVEQ